MFMTKKSPIFGTVTDPFPSVPGAVRFFDDFVGASFSTTADAAKYYARNVDDDSDTEVYRVEDGFPGGAGVIIPGNNATDSVTISPNGEAFQTLADGHVLFCARFKVEDADQDKFFVGMHEDSALSTDGSVLAETTKDGIGFYADHTTGGTATLKCVCGNGTSQTTYSTSVTVADDTFIKVGFKVFNRDRVEFYVDSGSGWNLVTTMTSYIPTSVMTLAFQGMALDTGADDFTIDYWLAQCDLART